MGYEQNYEQNSPHQQESFGMDIRVQVQECRGLVESFDEFQQLAARRETQLFCKTIGVFMKM